MTRTTTRAIAAFALMMLGVGTAAAQPKADPDEPRIQYVGGITLCANNPKTLAQWYTDKFGLKIDGEYHGIYFGSVKYKDIEMDFGIHPAGDDCHKAEKGFAITFHVDNYARYIDKLKSKGLVPSDTDKEPNGQFAYFLDLENNKIAIWGD
jgi:catechol 2,3-dioxygenase-like lactoylglutathione lyase family enzyme